MSSLLLDAGNSLCKLANYNKQADKIGTILKVSYSGLEQELLKRYSIGTFTTIWVSNVNNSDVNQCLLKVSKTSGNFKINQFRTNNHKSKLTSDYDNIKSLGCDRWAAMLAVAYLYEKKNFCVIDCGTAITIDLVINFRHIGGLIAPGLKTSFVSLRQNTANLPHMSASEDSIHLTQTFANSTQACILSGVYNQAVALVEKTIASCREKYTEEIHLYITGGDAKVLANLTDLVLNKRENLVLEGLRAAIKFNLFK